MSLLVAIILFCLGVVSLAIALGIATAYGGYKAAKVVEERNKKNGQAYI